MVQSIVVCVSVCLSVRSYIAKTTCSNFTRNFPYMLPVAIAWSCFDENAIRYVLPVLCVPPFPQIDIIGAVVIVWRVRGETIRSVLCNIVCNNCAQCDAHT